MSVFKKIRRHAAIASADFAAMFKDVEIPPLPAALARLIAEVNQPEPDIDKVAKLISSTPELAAKVIKTVNSALYGLRTPVTNVKHAVTLLGLRDIRSIALAYGTMEALPRPNADLFDQVGFWTDSLLRATLARSLAKRSTRGQLEEAFTSSLLADVALPVLLTVWSEYYEPVIAEWRQTSRRLSEIEREHFRWDHAQAGAWILQSWEFPEEMVCFIGAHDLSWEEIHKLELESTVVAPMAVAAHASSVLKPDAERSGSVHSSAIEQLSMDTSMFVQCIAEVRESLGEILDLFGLPDRDAGSILDDMVAGVDHGEET
jgi:HD-like signal output (HDOD) protein